jgi:hypothetical protein
VEPAVVPVPELVGQAVQAAELEADLNMPAAQLVQEPMVPVVPAPQWLLMQDPSVAPNGQST